jgi:hypothetical protein
MMKKIITIPIVAFFSIYFMGNGLYSYQKKYIFKDQTIIDEKTGITIMTNETKDLIIVTNYILQYAIIFPYNNKWEFEINDKYALIGNCGTINISLQIHENNNKTTEEFMSDLMKIYTENKSKYGVIDAKLIKYNKDLVLQTVVDPTIIYKDDTFKNVKQINYYSTKTFNNLRYEYHSSVIVDNDKKINEKDFLNFATKGFFIDFGRK